MHHVDPERLFPGLSRIANSQRADVAHQRIYATQFSRAVGHPFGKCSGIGHIQRLTAGLDAHALERSHCGVYFCGIAGAHRDVGAFSREALGHRPPNPFAAASDQHTLSFESKVHCISPKLQKIAE